MSILVTGATGSVGSATIKALIALDSPYTILALTRDPTSDRAKALAALSPGKVRTVQGDLKDVRGLERIFEEDASGIRGVFSLQDPFHGDEVLQGKTLVDLAAKYLVPRFVYLSVDNSGLKPNPVPHFDTKRLIEAHIHRTLPPSVGWTILRPSTFFDNISWPNYLQAVRSYAPDPESYPLKSIAVADIGRAAATVFSAEEAEYEAKFRGQTINLTGDDGTVAEFFQVLKEEKGWEFDSGKEPDPSMAPIKVFFEALAHHPYEGKSETTKESFPFVKSFRQWLQTEYSGKA